MCWLKETMCGETSAYLRCLCVTVRPVSPVVVVTPVYSGDAAAVGELAEETATEWTDRAGEYDPGDGEAGVVSVSVNSSSVSAEGVKRGQTIRQSITIIKYTVALRRLNSL